MIISSIFRGYVVQYFHIKIAFLITAILSSLFIIGGLIYFESHLKGDNQFTEEFTDKKISVDNNININKIEEKTSVNNLCFKFISLLKIKKIIIPLIYILVLSAVPSFYESSFYYLSDVEGFKPSNFGQLTILLMILFLIISVVNKKYLKEKNPKTIILCSTMISFVFSSIYNLWIILKIKSKVVAIISISFYVAIKSLSLKPIMNLAFLICPKGYEGSIISLFYSTADFGATLSSLFGSLLAFVFDIQNKKYSTFSLMIFTNNIILLVPLIGIFIIDDYILSPPSDKTNELNY